MLFNSFNFLVFFTMVTVLYYTLPHRLRWVLLLISSYYFYMCWRPELIILIVFSTFINYFLALLISREKSKTKKKNYLIISLIINFSLLFLFKYSVFLNETAMNIYTNIASWYYSIKGVIPEIASENIAQALSRYPAREFDIILPMGISFYTFQAASYTIDVYNGKIKAVRHYGIFSLFITFFPQLVAGPIERSKNLLPQFFKKHYFNREHLLMGVRLMLLGFFKKIVIADRVSVAVNTIYNSPESYEGLSFIIATILFTFQIYCDFSGYSDIAMGSAKVLGFDLMMNFNKPYLSKSIKEFWRKWHISLSTWFMDYVYIPLGGNRQGLSRQCGNLLATFLVSGLWHGANWTFVLWGGLHGVYLVIGILTKKYRDTVKRVLYLENSVLLTVCSVITTFVLVAVGWVFFRANTVTDAFYIIGHFFDGSEFWLNPEYVYRVAMGMGSNLFELKIMFFAILLLMFLEFISGKYSVFEYFEKKNYILRFVFYVFISVTILTTGVYYNGGEFLYFQF